MLCNMTAYIGRISRYSVTITQYVNNVFLYYPENTCNTQSIVRHICRLCQKRMANQLAHHLRLKRLGSGLTQRDTAYLLGSGSPGTVYNYEARLREPDLRSALAYGVIFGVPIEQLFPGIYDEVEKKVTKRAQTLQDKLGEARGNPTHWYKQKTLRAIPHAKAGEPKENV